MNSKTRKIFLILLGLSISTGLISIIMGIQAGPFDKTVLKEILENKQGPMEDYQENVDINGPFKKITVYGISGDILLRESPDNQYHFVFTGQVLKDGTEKPYRFESIDGLLEIHLRPEDKVKADSFSLSNIKKFISNTPDMDVTISIPPKETPALLMNTVSGDIGIQAKQVSDLNIKTVSGDVEIQLDTGVKYDVDIKTVSGDVDNVLSTAPTANKGQGTISIETVSGDVEIRNELKESP